MAMINNLKYKLAKIWLYFKRPSYRKKGVFFGSSLYVNRQTIFEGHNQINGKGAIISSFIGFGTYIGEKGLFINTKIGRFSSIGPEVTCIIGNHPSNTFVSTHPAFFSLRKQAGFTFTNEQLFEEFAKARDNEGKYSILIGNDVWIGHGVRLIDGVKIGDGAIVAAGAMVTKDVAPYTIVGGVPAKVIRKRFTEDQINFLLDFQWWNKDLNWIRKHAHLFTDIESFMNAVQKSCPE
jgi:acetyltransferase-like isoleucine patch superfamily enzyme